MIKSMTAYGRKTYPLARGILTVEIHSVNGKGLNIAIKGPGEFLVFDIPLRRLLGQKMQRGQITVRLNIECLDETSSLSKIKEKWEKVAKELSLDPSTITIPFLAEEERRGAKSSDSVGKEELFSAVEDVLTSFEQMREAEGLALSADITLRLRLVEQACKAVEKETNAVSTYREKLQKTIQELGFEDDERIAKEVALFADRICITEELVRLKSHIEQFTKHLESDESVGKILDFLLQEMHREVNTISSKSQEVAITKSCVLMKSELAKIREQVANVE